MTTATASPAAQNGDVSKTASKATPKANGNSSNHAASREKADSEVPEFEIAKQTGGKPDQDAHNKTMDALKKNIDKTQAEVNNVRALLSGAGPTKDSPAGQRRAVLRSELEELRNKQAGSKGSRGKVFEEIKALQENVSKKIKDVQAAKSKAPYKSVADVDAQIARLEAQVEAGSLKLVDEKKALNEISSLRRSRKAVEGLQGQQDAIDADRKKIDQLKATLDDPESKALGARYDAIKTELDALAAEHEKTAGSRSKLLDQRTALSARLDELYAERRARAAAFRAESDKFYARIKAEREKRDEKYRAEQKAKDEERRKAHEEELREEAALPAFAKDIDDCDALIAFFSAKIGGGAAAQPTAAASTASTSTSFGKKLELRTVSTDDAPAGARVARKKGDETDEDAYFVAGGGKKKGGKKGGASAAAGGKGKGKGVPLSSLDDDAESGATAAASSSGGALHVPLGHLSALLALSIPPPGNTSDVPRVIENLKLKKAYFVQNQDKKTRENIERVNKLLSKKNGADGETATDSVDETDKVASEGVAKLSVSDATPAGDKIADATETEEAA